MAHVEIARVYVERADSDGCRVLVDRLWPRGMRKDDVRIDRWCKDVAPSTELRTWYSHDEDKYEEFAERYRGELSVGAASDALVQLRELAADGPLTLLTASKALEISQAAVLADILNH